MSGLYLGDGVYVSFDGYHVKLMTESHVTPKEVIYLNPEVWISLIATVVRMMATVCPEHGRPIVSTGLYYECGCPV